MSNQTDTITVVTADEAPAKKSWWKAIIYFLDGSALTDYYAHKERMAEAKRIADEKAAVAAAEAAALRAYENALEVTANFALYGAKHPDKLNLLMGLLPVVTAEAAELANNAEAIRAAAELALQGAMSQKVADLNADLEAAERERKALELRLAARHAQVAEAAETKIAGANVELQTATGTAEVASEKHNALTIAAAALNL